ncbi:MAG TPA: TMEM175 family protein [Candidatus Peribacteria bacterium]|nr:TMEM175 family protein [Candidatus Peribacteria bacterium]
MVAVYHDMLTVLPKLLSFAFSFIVLCIFWVNHHHFYHQLTHLDWPLLWHNCNLLFWLCIVPFTTAFVGDYPAVPLVISAYAFVLCMASLAFRLMARHAFFHSDLTGGKIAAGSLRKEFNRILPGVVGYAFAVIAPYASIWLAWAVLVLIPLIYFVPKLAKPDECDEI